MLPMILPLALFGCGEGGPFGAEDGTEGTPDTTPRISLTTPVASEQRYGRVVEAVYAVEHLELDADAIGGMAVEGRGHVHTYVDGVLVGETADTTYTFEDLPSGGHTLEVRLAANNHDELWEGNWVYVETLDPTLSIVSPADGTTFAASSAPLVLQLTDFNVSRDVAFGEPAFGKGRYNVLVDDVVVDVGLDAAAVEVTQIPEGTHEVAIELVTADGVPLDPPVRDAVSIEVLPTSPYVAIDRAPYLEEHASATVPLAIAAANVPLAYHLYVDGEYALGATEPQVTLNHVAAGYHFVELRVTDGGSELPIRDHLHLFVSPARPDVAITYPGEGWGVPPEFELAVMPEGFTLDAGAMGGANVAGHGHWSVSVDGVVVEESGSSTAPLTGLLSGDRVIRVTLENNDHTPLDPPVYTEISVTVE